MSEVFTVWIPGITEDSESTVRPTGIYFVTSYGATGDGVTDDTTAIQDAIDDAQDSGGGTIFFPPGTYLVSTVTLPRYVNVLGVHREASILVANGVGYVLDVVDLGVVGTILHQSIREIGFIGNAAAAGAIRLRRATRYKLDRIYITGFTNGKGIYLDEQGWIGSIHDCWIRTCDYGIDVQSAAGEAGNAIHISGGEIQACTVGVRIGDSAGGTAIGKAILFTGELTIEGCDDGAIHVFTANNIVIDGCYFESNNYDGVGVGKHILLGEIAGAQPDGCRILNCWFQGLGYYAVRIENARDTVLAFNDCRMDFVNTQPGCDQTSLLWNRVTGTRINPGDQKYIDIIQQGNMGAGSVGSITEIVGYWETSPYTPASTADANGRTGTWTWDDSFIYVKTSVGWKRATLNAF